MDADVEDLTQEALWALHLAHDKTPDPAHATAFAYTVMRRAMLGYYRGGRSRRIGRTGVVLSLDANVHQNTRNTVARALVTHPQHDDALELDAYFSALERTHGDTARRIAENLIAPRDPHVCAFFIAQAHAKAHIKDTTGAALRGIDKLRISRRQLRKALGVSRPAWRAMMRDIKAFTRHWLAR